jgi:hypothetical protein
MNRGLLAAALALCGGFLGCGGIDGPPPCNAPSTTVVLDAAVDGLPDVGEYTSAKNCEPFCEPQYPMCYRVSELVLRCLVGCR